MRQQADYLRGVHRTDQPHRSAGEMAGCVLAVIALRTRPEEIAEGVKPCVSALDASQVVDDVESSAPPI